MNGVSYNPEAALKLERCFLDGGALVQFEGGSEAPYVGRTVGFACSGFDLNVIFAATHDLVGLAYNEFDLINEYRAHVCGALNELNAQLAAREWPTMIHAYVEFERRDSGELITVFDFAFVGGFEVSIYIDDDEYNVSGVNPRSLYALESPDAFLS